MQGVPDGIDLRKVHNDIVSVENISGIHELHIWAVNSEDVFLSCHACADTKNIQSNQIIQKINAVLENKYNITHSAIQLEDRGACKEGDSCCEK